MPYGIKIGLVIIDSELVETLAEKAILSGVSLGFIACKPER